MEYKVKHFKPAELNLNKNFFQFFFAFVFFSLGFFFYWSDFSLNFSSSLFFCDIRSVAGGGTITCLSKRSLLLFLSSCLTDRWQFPTMHLSSLFLALFTTITCIYMIWHYNILYDIIWYMIWYYNIWYMIWHYNIWYDILYDIWYVLFTREAAVDEWE